MATALAAACALLILIFYTGLPELKELQLSDGGERHLGRRDVLVILTVCVLYSSVAFTGLGDTEAPQTSRTFNSDSEIVTLSEQTHISSAMLFCGTDVGSYTFEISADGSIWLSAASYEQSYISVLKWETVDLSMMPDIEAKYLRVTGYGHVTLSEIALFDDSGALIGTQKCALTDEQELVPEAQHFMNSSYFDEIYHARTAYEYMNGTWPYEISHPPLGKLIISIGIAIFGLVPFGWRFMGTLFGVLMIPVIYAFSKRLFGGRTIPVCCSVILAADFMHLVQTRIATIDTYGTFFTLLMYLFMYEYLTSEKKLPLGLSGICFGLGCACKWTCVYAGAGLGVIWAVHWIIRAVSEKKAKLFPEFVKNSLFCIVFFVILPCAIYYCSYYPYGIARGMSGIGMLFTKEYADIVIDNQTFMFSYHSGVHATHPYSSRWYQWIFDIRPILYYLNYGTDGTHSSFGAWVNPVLCWAGLLSLFVLGYRAIFRHDRKAAFILTAYLAQLVPWMFITRTTFEYHYFPCSVFLVLSLGYVFDAMRSGRKNWRLYSFGLTALCTAVFILFLPALKGAIVDNTYAQQHFTWLSTWPF